MTEFMDELPAAAAPGRQGDPGLAAFAQDLSSNLGKWAKWPRETKNPCSTSNAIKKGVYRALRNGFETAVRHKVLYVRYVGDTAAEML